MKWLVVKCLHCEKLSWVPQSGPHICLHCGQALARVGKQEEEK